MLFQFLKKGRGDLTPLPPLVMRLLHIVLVDHFQKTKERILKLKETGGSQYIYQDEGVLKMEVFETNN